ncbi:rod shape-determining protein MreC [bacterium]|nr:rod shape-determining protein MreC [bacterium]
MHFVLEKIKGNHSLLIWLIIFILSIILFNLKIGVKHQIGEIFQSTIFYPFEQLVLMIDDLKKYHDENLTLRHKVTKLSLEIDLLEEERRENERLRELLNFKKKVTFETILGEVIGKGSLREPSHIMVNVGTLDGVRPNTPVIVREGIVGKVIETLSRASYIQPIFDRNFKVSAMDAQTRVVGIVQWKEGGFLEMVGVPITENASVGDVVISSGYGPVFPKGLKIGVIHRVENPKDKLFKTIDVIPYADPNKVEEVFILLPEKDVDF